MPLVSINDDSHSRGTVADIRSMDEGLARQFQRWPAYRRVVDSDGALGDFANHCSRCNTPQDDMYLHSEPDAPFFDIPHAPAGSITMTPLAGTVHMNGDEHFMVE